MNRQQEKIRYGLILQGVLAHALNRAGIDFVETPQYAEGSEKPDFLIPDDENPRIMIEVHQTEARNAFQMKTLRCVTAVTEAKMYFGDEMIAVNVLFGNPHTEVPEANLRSMCGLFDHNILLIDHIASDHLYAVQETAFQLAGTDGVTTSNAADQVVSEHEEIVGAIAQVMSSQMEMASTNPRLLPLWQMERARQNSLADPPLAGLPTYYKRNILRSLFFTDDQFQELLSTNDPEDLSQEVQEQLLRCKLATITEEMWGDVIEIDASFSDFLRNPEASRIRDLCMDRLDENIEMQCFFNDIRDKSHREDMCIKYLNLRNESWSNIGELILDNLNSDLFEGVEHRRCWVADILARELGVPHNRFNSELVQAGIDPENLGNPFNQLSYKSSRFMGKSESHKIYCEGIQSIAQKLATERSGDIADNFITLSNRLLELRLEGVIKLQKLNPLYLVLEAACETLDLNFEYISTPSLISDFAELRRSTGKYRVYHLTDGARTIIANALAPNENPGDKAKEWGARCQAMLYRDLGNGVVHSDVDAALMILDGIWENDDVARLFRAGWTHVARLDQIEAVLREIFSIKSDKLIEITEEELPLAAEEDGPQDLEIS